jgi:Protein of unknown function (DUF3311)
MPPAPSSNVLFARVILAAIPAAALTIAIPFVNRIEPRIFGAPFLMSWIVLWVILTPAFLWMVGRVERHW